MSGRYVPPALRRQNRRSSNGKIDDAVSEPAPKSTQDASFSMLEIAYHFWPDGGQSNVGGKTMHDSAATPGKLAYLFLFDGANPRWETDHIIFTKTSLHLLPTNVANDTEKAFDLPEETSKDATKASSVPEDNSHSESDSNPIAVFRQRFKSTQNGRNFEFQGWFYVDKVEFLEPKSDELVRMLEQKWAPQDKQGRTRVKKRDEAAWRDSLHQRWAVVKLRKDESERDPPKIESYPDQDADGLQEYKKSVNEMLAELRMGGKSKEESESTTS